MRHLDDVCRPRSESEFPVEAEEFRGEDDEALVFERVSRFREESRAVHEDII